jgi:hypothetical protein
MNKNIFLKALLFHSANTQYKSQILPSMHAHCSVYGKSHSASMISYHLITAYLVLAHTESFRFVGN